MKKKMAVLAALILVVALAIAPALWAEPAGRPGGPPDMPPEGPSDGIMPPYDDRGPGGDDRPGGVPSQERMEQVRKRVEMVRIWKLTEALDLDEKTADKVFPILRKYDRKKMVLQREKFELLKQVKQTDSDRANARSGASVDSGALLKKLEENRSALIDAEAAQQKELKKVLTPEQMLKYMTFEENFRRDMRQMLKESRGGRDGSRSGREGGSDMRGRGPDDRGRGGQPAGMEEDGMPPQRRRR